MFRQIFNVDVARVDREFALCDGAECWEAASGSKAGTNLDQAREVEDLLVQQQVMDEDPDAFGGMAAPGSGSKTSASVVVSHARLEQELLSAKTAFEEVFTAKASVEQALVVAKSAAEEALAAKAVLEHELLISKTAAEEALAATKDLKRAKIAAEVALAKERARADQTASELGEAIIVRDQVLVSKVEADMHLRAAETALFEHAQKMRETLKQKDEKIASLRAACKQGLKGGSKDAEARAAALQGRVGTLEQEYAELKAQLEAERGKVREETARVLGVDDAPMAGAGEGAAGGSPPDTGVITAKDRSRLARAVADKEEAIAQRDRVLLAKLGVDEELKEAQAKIADFPRVLGEAIRKKHQQFESEGMALVRAEVAKYKVEAEKRHQKEVDKLKHGMLDDAKMHIEPLQLKVYTAEIEIKKQTEEIKRLRAARGPLLRDLDDMRRKLRLMQTRRDQCRGFEGADEANIDPVEDEEALMTVTEKLRRDLKYTEERLGAAEACHQGLERSFAAARQEWASEKKGLQAQLEGKDREAHELAAAAMSDAVVKERWGMLPKFAEVQAEYDRRAAECAQRLEAQAEAHREQVQRMQKESVEAETRWRQTVERMEDEREDLEEELAMLELRASAGVGVSGESGEVAEVVVEQVPKPDHDRLLASERAIAAQAVHHSAEAVRLLEAEQAKVRDLLERLELGPDTAAGQAVEAEKQRAESARQAAEEQAKRAARMEAEAKDAKQELAKRMDAGRAMLGEVYRSYEEVLKDNRQLRARLAKVDKLRQEAGLRVESALASEKRAKDFVEVLKGQRGGADPDDQAQALRAAELCLHAEIALRHDAEAKVARLNLQRRADQARLVQLQSELREADARAEEVSSQMRGGPFAGF